MVKKLSAKKVGAVALGLGIIAGTVLGAVVYNPVQEIPVYVTQYEEKIVEVPVEVIKEVEKIVEVEKEVIVQVDNGDMDFILCRLEDKLIIEDCDEIVAELKAEDEAIKQAFDFVNKNKIELFDLLEDEGIIADEDDVKLIKVYNDFEDVNIIKADFDDEEYELELRYKIEDLEDEVKKFILVTVSIEDGEAKIDSVVEE